MREADQFQVGVEYLTNKGRARVLQANLGNPKAKAGVESRNDWFRVELLDSLTGDALDKEPIIINCRAFQSSWQMAEIHADASRVKGKILKQLRASHGAFDYLDCMLNTGVDDFFLDMLVDDLRRIFPSWTGPLHAASEIVSHHQDHAQLSVRKLAQIGLLDVAEEDLTCITEFYEANLNQMY